MDLNDRLVDRLRHVAALPDFSATRYRLAGEIARRGMGVDAVAGTPAYRAPEPVLDFRSDIYALGGILCGKE